MKTTTKKCGADCVLDIRDGDYIVLREGAFLTIRGLKFTRFKVFDAKRGRLIPYYDDGYEIFPYISVWVGDSYRKHVAKVSENIADICDIRVGTLAAKGRQLSLFAA